MKKAKKIIKFTGAFSKQEITLIVSDELTKLSREGKIKDPKIDKVNQYFRENPDWEDHLVLLRPGML